MHWIHPCWKTLSRHPTEGEGSNDPKPVQHNVSTAKRFSLSIKFLHSSHIEWWQTTVIPFCVFQWQRPSWDYKTIVIPYFESPLSPLSVLLCIYNVETYCIVIGKPSLGFRLGYLGHWSWRLVLCMKTGASKSRGFRTQNQTKPCSLLRDNYSHF